MAVVCALKLLTSGGFQLILRLAPQNHPRAVALGHQPSAHTTSKPTYPYTYQKKSKIWQLDVSLSLTSASALRASADKLTSFLTQLNK